MKTSRPRQTNSCNCYIKFFAFAAEICQSDIGASTHIAFWFANCMPAATLQDGIFLYIFGVKQGIQVSITHSFTLAQAHLSIPIGQVLESFLLQIVWHVVGGRHSGSLGPL